MINVSVETKALMDRLEAVRARGLKYALAMAMTWTARSAAEAFKRELAERLDRPTPLTLRSSRYKPATKDRDQYDVYIQDEASKGVPPSRYLDALARGGYRANKRSENLLRAKGILPPGWQMQPGKDAQLDAYGNLAGGGARYVQLLSGLQAFQERGHQMNRTAASVQRRAPKLRDYFVMYDIKARKPIGVFERRGKAVLEWLHFTPKRAKYDKVLDFKGTVQRIWSQDFEENFKLGLLRMLNKVASW